MGIFGNIFGGSDSPVFFSKEDPILGLNIGIVASYGHIFDDEVSEVI
jgi:hypothetical protein